jgi:hypothetical protein
MRNHIIIPIRGDLFLPLLRGDIHADREAIPRNARFVGAYFEPQSNAFQVVVEHESFAPVAPGMLAPVVHIELSKMA